MTSLKVLYCVSLACAENIKRHISILFADRVAMTPCPIAFKVCVVERSFIMYAALLYDPSGFSILRFAFSDDSARSEHATLIREHSSHRFGHVAEPHSRALSSDGCVVPPMPSHPIRVPSLRNVIALLYATW